MPSPRFPSPLWKVLTVVVFHIVLKNAPEEMAALNFEIKKTVSGKRSLVMNIVAIVLCLGLVIAPFIFNPVEYTGTDDQGMDAITEIDESYTPWFESLFEPSSDQMEITLFSIQTAIGAGLLGFFLGRLKRRPKQQDEHASS